VKERLHGRCEAVTLGNLIIDMFFKRSIFLDWGGGVDSAVGIATGYGDRFPVGARFSATVQTGLGLPSLPYSGHRVSFPGVKRPWRSVTHPI
jgi:hypothetical protein